MRGNGEGEGSEGNGEGEGDTVTYLFMDSALLSYKLKDTEALKFLSEIVLINCQKRLLKSVTFQLSEIMFFFSISPPHVQR